jgi:hypothetical protein
MVPIVTIITSVLNEIENIGDHVKSLNNYKNNVNFIFVDGGSSDGTYEFLRGQDKLTCIQKMHSTIYEALNAGLEQVNNNSEYVVFLGVGDFLDVDFLNNVDSKFDIIYPNLFYIESNKIKKSISHVEKDYNWGEMPFPHIGTLYKLSLFKYFGCFKEKYKIAGDLEWLLRVFNEYREGKIDLKTNYLSQYNVYMKEGGLSTNPKSADRLHEEIKEIYRCYPFRVSIKRNIFLILNRIWARK